MKNGFKNFWLYVYIKMVGPGEKNQLFNGNNSYDHKLHLIWRGRKRFKMISGTNLFCNCSMLYSKDDTMFFHSKIKPMKYHIYRHIPANQIWLRIVSQEDYGFNNASLLLMYVLCPKKDKHPRLEKALYRTLEHIR